MLPWIQLDRTTIPGDAGELRLKQRGSEFSIMLGSTELMNSRLSGSEEALAALSCERISGRRSPNLLIGGLGMGFTLRAALKNLPEDSGVVVAELVPAVVEWARGPLADIHAGTLDDPRVRVHIGDVGTLIRSQTNAFDAILLDVDNGPDGLTRASNDDLYSYEGLRAAKAALRQNGVLAIWSSARDQAFTKRLRATGFVTEELSVRAKNNGGGARHVVWMATRS